MRLLLLITCLGIISTAHAETSAKSAISFCILSGNSAGIIAQIRKSDTLKTFEENVNKSNRSKTDKILNIAIAKEVYNTIPADTSVKQTEQIIFNRCIKQFKIHRKIPKTKNKLTL